MIKLRRTEKLKNKDTQWQKNKIRIIFKESKQWAGLESADDQESRSLTSPTLMWVLLVLLTLHNVYYDLYRKVSTSKRSLTSSQPRQSPKRTVGFALKRSLLILLLLACSSVLLLLLLLLLLFLLVHFFFFFCRIKLLFHIISCCFELLIFVGF